MKRKRNILLALTLASFAGNLVGLWSVTHRKEGTPSRQLTPTPPRRQLAPSTGRQASAVSTDARLGPFPPITDFGSISSWLTAKGVPKYVRDAILDVAISDHYNALLASLKSGPGTPQDKTGKAALLRTEFQATVLEYIGDIQLEDELLFAKEARRCGIDDREKLEHIRSLERQFQEKRSRLLTMAIPAEPVSAVPDIEKEFEQNLREILQPDELREYNIRNGRSARTLSNTLRSFEPSENEYRDLLTLVESKLRDPAIEGSRPAQVESALLGDPQQVIATIGADRYTDLVQALNPEASHLNAFVRRIGLDLGTARKLWELHVDFEKQTAELSQLDGPDSLARQARVKDVYDQREAQLSKILTKEQIELFKRAPDTYLFPK